MPNKRRNAPNRAVARNLVAKNQWQRGGVHEKTNKAKRQKAKQSFKNDIRVGKPYSDFFITFFIDGGSSYNTSLR